MRAKLAALWFCFWLCSLALPVAIMGPSSDNIFPGWFILIMGWLGLLVGQLGWFANIAFLASLGILAFSRTRTLWGSALSLVLTALAADGLLWHEMYGDNGSAPIQAFGAGYYLWFAAMVGAGTSLACCASVWIPAHRTEQV